MFKRSERIISKYYRIRMTDQIKQILQELPVINLEESRSNSCVYAGRGQMEVGGFIHPAYIQIRLVQKSPRVYIRVPDAKLSIVCPFDPKRIHEIVRNAIRISLN